MGLVAKHFFVSPATLALCAVGIGDNADCYRNGIGNDGSDKHHSDTDAHPSPLFDKWQYPVAFFDDWVRCWHDVWLRKLRRIVEQCPPALSW